MALDPKTIAWYELNGWLGDLTVRQPTRWQLVELDWYFERTRLLFELYHRQCVPERHLPALRTAARLYTELHRSLKEYKWQREVTSDVLMALEFLKLQSGSIIEEARAEASERFRQGF